MSPLMLMLMRKQRERRQQHKNARVSDRGFWLVVGFLLLSFAGLLGLLKLWPNPAAP